MPNITLRLKRLGKKRLHSVPYQLSEDIRTLADLLATVVGKEVDRFNASREAPKLFSFLTPADIQEQSKVGKVGFGNVSNVTQADPDDALLHVLQAHADGIFLVYVNDEEITDLRTELTLTENTEVTFLRLTFLTGLLWK